MGYDEVLEILEEQHQCKLENNTYWQFKQITGHQHCSNKDDLNYKGCDDNVTVEWEDSSITHEPLNIFGCDAPEICAESGQKHDLLNEPGWKWFHHIAKSKKKLQCMINAMKVESFHNTVQYLYDLHIPFDTKEALTLDEENSKVIRCEIQQLMDYNTFIDKGLRKQMLNDYTK